MYRYPRAAGAEGTRTCPQPVRIRSTSTTVRPSSARARAFCMPCSSAPPGLGASPTGANSHPTDCNSSEQRSRDAGPRPIQWTHTRTLRVQPLQQKDIQVSAAPLPIDDASQPDPFEAAAATSREPAEVEDTESQAATVDLLHTYVRQIGDGALLTRAEELELARRKDMGDDDAKKQLVESNLRLVIAMARAYSSSGVPLLDLIQEGNMGLMRAVEKFDYRRGYKLSTYA